MARIVIVLAGLLVLSVATIGFLSISIRGKNSDLKALRSEIEQKNEKIETARAALQQLKSDIEKGQKAAEKHIESTIKAGEDYAEKISIIESDPNACDWLDQPLPDTVVRIYSERICRDTDN